MWDLQRGAPFGFQKGTNTSTLYAVTGATNVSKVTAVNANGFVGIPTTATGPQGPTGIVSNANTAAFQLTPGVASTSARFIFANLNGTISGWAGGLTSTITATTPAAMYTGLAINTAGSQLYAANNLAGRIDVFASNFSPVTLGGAAFATPTAISNAGLVPFNVQNINGDLYVTYAPPGRPINAALGMGAVAVFNESGALLRTLDGVTGSLTLSQTTI